MAQIVHIGGHAWTASVVVGRDLQEVRRGPSLGVVFLRAIERAEGHGLQDVEAEGFLRRNRLRQPVQVRLHRLEAVTPQRLPAQYLGILEQNPPEGDEVTVRRPRRVGRLEQLREFAEPRLSAADRDAQRAALRLAELAEAHTNALSTAEHAVQRPHTFRAPGDAVNLTGIAQQKALDLATQEGLVVRMIEARTGRTTPIDVDLGNLTIVRDEARECRAGVIQVPGEEVHASCLGLGCGRFDDVETAILGGTKVLQDRVLKVLRIIVIERAAGDGGAGLAMVGQGRLQARLAISEGVGPDRVDVALLLNVIQHGVHALVHPTEAADLDRDEVLAVVHRLPVSAACRSGRGDLGVAGPAHERCGG